MNRTMTGVLVLLAALPSLAQAGNIALKPVVEAEEEVYSFVPADNGASPFWCFGLPILVRIGEELFASGLETLPEAKPLHNVRWMLFRRNAAGWELQQVDPVGRTREPCPLVGFADGRLFLSANPTLVTDPEKKIGPARPEFVEFSAADPKGPFKIHLPPWKGSPPFAEHTYRYFGADAASGRVILLNQIGYSHKEWALLERDGAWATGQLMNIPSREGDIHAYKPGYKLHRLNYGSVALKGRAAYIVGGCSYANWDRVGEKELEKILGGKTARERFGSQPNRRRLMYASTPDLGVKPFAEWMEIANTMANGGWLFPGDLWIAPDGAAHILWGEGPLDRRIRDTFFPDIKLTYAIKYAIVRDGRVVHRATLMEGGEGLGSEIPGTHPRFQITPDDRLFAVYYVSGTNADGVKVSENRILELLPDGSLGKPVTLPLQHPLRVVFTATPRGGSAPSVILDMLGSRADGAPSMVCYTRVRLW
jgi:hypothetical protein